MKMKRNSRLIAQQLLVNHSHCQRLCINSIICVTSFFLFSFIFVNIVKKIESKQKNYSNNLKFLLPHFFFQSLLLKWLVNGDTLKVGYISSFFIFSGPKITAKSWTMEAKHFLMLVNLRLVYFFNLLSHLLLSLLNHKP